jgi:NadR type nicotinamide-nucleotide adenylyltransferase
VKKLCLTGPESSGKTTLAQQLATHYHTTFVPEYARTYLQQTNGYYQQPDLLYIAQGQYHAQIASCLTAPLPHPDVVIWDTDLLVIKIWSEVKYGNCHPDIVAWWQRSLPSVYILCQPDIPWQYDELRENPNDRWELFSLYRQALDACGVPYLIVQGTPAQRMHQVLQTLPNLC